MIATLVHNCTRHSICGGMVRAGVRMAPGMKNRFATRHTTVAFQAHPILEKIIAGGKWHLGVGTNDATNSVGAGSMSSLQHRRVQRRPATTSPRLSPVPDKVADEASRMGSIRPFKPSFKARRVKQQIKSEGLLGWPCGRSDDSS